jgi:hypothetical protein
MGACLTDHVAEVVRSFPAPTAIISRAPTAAYDHLPRRLAPQVCNLRAFDFDCRRACVWWLEGVERERVRVLTCASAPACAVSAISRATAVATHRHGTT